MVSSTYSEYSPYSPVGKLVLLIRVEIDKFGQEESQAAT